MRKDPITLYIATELNREFANGTIYMDDGETLNYVKNNEFLYWLFVYEKQSDSLYSIKSINLNENGIYDPQIMIEKILIRGIRYYPRNIHLYTGKFYYY